MKLDLRRFFRWTGVFILFVAAGLIAGAVRAFHEAGLWNGLQQTAFDLSAVLPQDGVLGTLLSGLLRLPGRADGRRGHRLFPVFAADARAVLQGAARRSRRRRPREAAIYHLGYGEDGNEQ